MPIRRATRLAALLLPLALCQCKSTKSLFKQPRVGAADAEGWEAYLDEVIIKRGAVRWLNPGQGTPEAAVVQFYACWMRRDACWQKVLPPGWQRSPRIQHKLGKMRRWKIQRIKLLSRKNYERGGYWIKLHLTIGADGKVESGTDEATVRKSAGKWYVVSPPT